MFSFQLKLAENNSVKIADVGASKEAKDITGTLTGTPVYMAPEVFHGKVYNFKADIYNLGIILWEMWHGRPAFADLRGQALTDIFRKIDEGYRPRAVGFKGSNYRPPPSRWEKLMSQCWSGDPTERPSARKCYLEMKKLSRAVIRR